MKKHKWVALALAAMLSINVTAFATETEPKTENTENIENTQAQPITEQTQNQDTQQQTDTQTSEQTQTTNKTLTPVWVMAENPPAVTAGAAILIEPETGTILYEKKCKRKNVPSKYDKNYDRFGCYGLFKTRRTDCCGDRSQ